MNEKNRLVFVVLAAFLGFLGVHSYYTGHKLKALFQFLPGICGVIVLILSCILSIYILLWPALILLLIPFAWAMYDVFTVGTDVYDVPMKEEHPALEFWLPILVDFVIPGLTGNPGQTKLLFSTWILRLNRSMTLLVSLPSLKF